MNSFKENLREWLSEINIKDDELLKRSVLSTDKLCNIPPVRKNSDCENINDRNVDYNLWTERRQKIVKESKIVDQKNTTSSVKSSEKENESAEHFKTKGNEFFKAKNYALSIDSYSKAISINPKCAIYWSNRAFAYLKLSR